MVENVLKVTVTGIDSKEPGKKMISTGSKVLLIKEPTNPFDQYAVRVLTEDASYGVGYVGNKPNTVLEGTISAKDLHNEWKEGDKIVGTVVKMDSIAFRTGHKSSAFIVELVLESDEKVADEVQQVRFKLLGAKTKYPSRQKVQELLKLGEFAVVRLFPQDDKIVAEYDGGLVGYVDTKAEGLTPYEEVVALVGDEKNAVINGNVGMALLGEFEVNPADAKLVDSAKSLSDIFKQIVDEGIATKRELDERLEYLAKHPAITNDQLKTIFESYVNYPDEVKGNFVEKPQTLYQDETNVLQRCIVYISCGKHLMLEGPKGIGKNVLVDTIAWLYKRPLFETAMNSQYDNHSFLGGNTIEITEEGGQKMVFVEEPFVQGAVYGGISLIDEINTGLAHVLSVTNPVLDDRRRIKVPGRKDPVGAHPNFLSIATMNKDYTGTFELNEATAERYVTIILEAPKSIKHILMAKFPEGINAKLLEDCDKLYKNIRKASNDNQISDKCVTIRGFITAIKANKCGLDIKTALIDNVAHVSKEDFERKIVRDAITDIFG